MPHQEDREINELKSRIQDLGSEIDTYKTKTGAALGVGVFLLLLTLGAVFDLWSSKTGAWEMIGLSRPVLIALTAVTGTGSMALLVYGVRQLKKRDFPRETRLEEMEEEYARLTGKRSSNEARRRD